MRRFRQILSDSEYPATCVAQVVHERFRHFIRVSQSYHNAGFGNSAAFGYLPQYFKTCFIMAAPVPVGLIRFYGFHIMGDYLRSGFDNHVSMSSFFPESLNQYFNGRIRVEVLISRDCLHPMGGSQIRQVVSVYGSDNGVGELH